MRTILFLNTWLDTRTQLHLELHIGTCLTPAEGNHKQLKSRKTTCFTWKNGAAIWLRSLKLITTFAREKIHGYLRCILAGLRLAVALFGNIFFIG